MGLSDALIALVGVFVVGMLLVSVLGLITWGVVAVIRKMLGRNH